MRIRQQHTVCKGQTARVPAYMTYPDKFVALNALFKILASGQHPDFLTIMAGLNEIVDFNAKDDNSIVENDVENLIMSLKKCRFCS